MIKKRVGILLLNLIAALLVLLILSPLILLFANAFRTTGEILRNPLAFPTKLYIGNFLHVFKETSFSRNLLNSFLVVVSTVAMCLIVAAPGGYALSRFKFFGKKALLVWLLSSQSFPGVLMAVGYVSLLRFLKLSNTLVGLTLLYTSFTLPFSCWLLKGFFDQIPIAVEEAALIDGCSERQAFLKVVLPLSVPGLISVGTFSFLLGWNEFFFALVLLHDPKLYTVPIYLSRFLGTGGAVEWGYLCSASAVYVIPPIILFLVFQKYLVSGLTSGAVK